PGLHKWHPDGWNRRRLADRSALAAVELVTVFGHGRHTCPAQPFSLSTMTAAATRLFAAFDMEPGWTVPAIRAWCITGLVEAEVTQVNTCDPRSAVADGVLADNRHVSTESRRVADSRCRVVHGDKAVLVALSVHIGLGSDCPPSGSSHRPRRVVASGRDSMVEADVGGPGQMSPAEAFVDPPQVLDQHATEVTAEPITNHDAQQGDI